jgi:hypothetical protein
MARSDLTGAIAVRPALVVAASTRLLGLRLYVTGHALSQMPARFLAMGSALPAGTIMGKRLHPIGVVALDAEALIAVAILASRGLHPGLGTVTVEECERMRSIGNQIVAVMTLGAIVLVRMTELTGRRIQLRAASVDVLPSGGVVGRSQMIP